MTPKPPSPNANLAVFRDLNELGEAIARAAEALKDAQVAHARLIAEAERRTEQDDG